ncbi:WSC-domain-containing protein [Pilatotrama ljubarskyi]|nr:WSC-domain-containing protein [Pilatotrama ljubarskyi]
MAFRATSLLLLVVAHGVRSFRPETIPLNWTMLSACAVDNPARILAGDVTTQVANNTPALCVTSCAAQGFGYAGVEFANECHCGTGLLDALQSAPATDCNMACAGDSTVACGGPWRIQVYSFPALRPGSWVYQGCVTDAPATPAFSGATTHTFASNLDFVNQCLQACAHSGFAFAGVEDASVCQCSSSAPVAAAQTVNEAQCNSLCPLPGNAGFEFCGGVNRLGVYKFAA